MSFLSIAVDSAFYF